MLVVERIAGNRNEDPALGAMCRRAAAAGVLEVARISFQDAQRGRMRVTTDAGTEIGVSIGRGAALRDGDVLCRSEERVVVVAVEPMEALVIRAGTGAPPDSLFELGVKLGHVLGNQHWPMRIESGRVLVPVTVDRRVMETVLRTHNVAGLEYEFAAVEPGEVPTAMPHIPHEHV